MSIDERRACVSACMGIMIHLVMILSLFFPFSSLTTFFLPGFTQTSGWEVILSPPATFFDRFIELVAFAMLFGPLLVYLGSVWLVFQQQKQWVKVLGPGAIGSLFLIFLGFACMCLLLLETQMGRSEASIVLGPAFWVPFSAFLPSFCCSLLLIIYLVRVRSTIHAKKAV